MADNSRPWLQENELADILKKQQHHEEKRIIRTCLAMAIIAIVAVVAIVIFAAPWVMYMINHW